MKKGFTLIELLAVIVILAIIAVIAVPIVITIISDSSASTAVRAGEFYVGAVENAIMSKNVETGGSFNPNECNIDQDGNVKCGETTLIIEMDGEKPVDGFLKFEQGTLVDTKIVFASDTIVMNNSGSLSNLENDIVCVKATEETKTTGNIPTGQFLLGDEYICEVKDNVKYHFFVLSTDGNNINLILDRNINSDGTLATKAIKTGEKANFVLWISVEDYNRNNVNGLTCVKDPCYADLGPITALNYVNNATKDWNNIKNLNEYCKDEPKNRYGDIKLTAKARLPKLKEITNAGCKEGESNRGYCPLWLVNYMAENSFVTGEGVENIDSTTGYWTSSSGYTTSAYCVHQDNRVRTITTAQGVRPVISVPKSDIY